VTAEPPADLPPHTDEDPALQPLDVDGVSAVTAGTAAWAVAFGVLLLLGVRFDDPNGWWLWVCATGAAVGVPGVIYTRRRRAAYRAAGRTAR
jgi:hypothetical protein